jgi:hypothetical protein
MTITVVWNSRGFHIMTTFPNDIIFDIGYYKNEILHEIKDWRQQQGVDRAWKFNAVVGDWRRDPA